MATSRPKADWTIMVYLAGDNNLTEEMVMALSDIKEFFHAPEGSTSRYPGNIAIVAQLDPSGLGIPTQRYDFAQPPKNSGDFLEDWRVEDYQIDDGNTGNPDALSGFVRWAHEKHAAERYALILSGHGSGSTEDFLMQDLNPIDSLSIPELKTALADSEQVLGRKIDILGMDACFMSMVEVCYAVRGSVKILVGAEGYEPEFGWPYHRILAASKAIRSDSRRIPDLSPLEPAELAKLIVKEYVDYYSDFDRTAGRSVDLAAIDLDEPKMEFLRSSFNELSDALRKAVKPEYSPHLGRVLLAHWYAQTYKFDQFVDMRDLCTSLQVQFNDLTEKARNRQIRALEQSGRHIKIRSIPFQIDEACKRVESALEACVLLSGCSGFAYQHSYGLSVYFPWATLSEDYHLMDFSVGTKWHLFLKDYVKRTQRLPRFDSAADSDQWVRENFAVGVLGGKIRRGAKPRFEKLLNRSERTGVVEDFDGGHKYGKRTKYGKVTKYGKRTKYGDDLERAMKNLPLVSGKDFWPKPPTPGKSPPVSPSSH